MKVGRIRRQCQVCGKYYFVQSYDTDFVHKCRKSDGTRRKTRIEQELIPGRVNLKIDDPNWNTLGLNPVPKVRTRHSQDKALFSEINIDTFIELA